MALDPVPWFIGGGAEHSADVARLVVHVATSGAAGIVSSGDLAVTQLPTPTGTVRVAAGSAIIPNTNAVQQSYALRAPSVTDLAVTPTGSAAGRSDLLVAYVDDPQFTGQVLPADQVALGPYVKFGLIEGVSPTATTVPPTFDFPAIPLARITLPVNTATVVQSMITDLRKVANPRSEKRTLVINGTSGTSSTAWITFPGQADWSLNVPSWATRAIVRANWMGINHPVGQSYGALRVDLGGTLTKVFPYDETTPSGSVIDRRYWAVIDDIAIPANIRGTSVRAKMQKVKTGGVNVVADSITSVALEVEFLEAAV